MVPADRRDKDRRNVRQIGGNGFLQFFVQQVAFGDRQQALLVEQFGVVLFQFVQQDAVFFAHVLRVGRDHEQQDRVAFDVTQEARSEPFAGMRPFDDTGDVGHHERLVVAAFDDAQIRFEGRKSVIRDFGLRRRNGCQQRRFPGVRESDQPDVGKHFQFEDEPSFDAILARLRIPRSLVGRRFEVPVAESSAASFQQDGLLSVFGDFADDFPGFRIACDGAQRHVDDDVRPVLPRAARPAARFAVLAEDVTLVLEVDQRPVLTVAAQDDAASVASVSAVRAAEFDEFLAAEMAGAGAAFTGAAEYFHVVDEVGRWHRF